MRLRVILLAILVVVAGCNGLPGGDAPVDPDDATGTTTTDGTATPTAGANESNNSSDTNERPVGPTAENDVLGSENGYWYNASLQIKPDDGLNESEQNAVISRSMARVETVRGLEFRQSVDVTIQSREEFKQQQQQQRPGQAFREFDNAKFEAMFLIGENKDSLSVQEKNRGTNILGYYSPKNRSIVLVSNSDTPTLSGEQTLSHELHHALQDQHFNLSQYQRATRDGYNAKNGLIEGAASFVERKYMAKCGNEWNCLPSKKKQQSSATPPDMGTYLLNFFPYADGPSFIKYFYEQGGWERVNELYSNPPKSAEQVISPERYESDSPANISLSDQTQNGWTRVRPRSPTPGALRPDYARLGESGIASMFAATLYDTQNRSSVIPRNAFLNTEGGSIDQSDPFNYGVKPAKGWAGDRLHVYEKGNLSGYVWQTKWDSQKDAQEFVGAYERLLSHWGGSKTKPNANIWVIQNGPYADAFRVTVTGETVTIVNAPTVSDLSDVRTG